MLPGPTGHAVNSVAFGPDDTLAVGEDTPAPYLWNTTTKKYITLPEPNGQRVDSIASGKDGALAAGDYTGFSYL